jgi:hypothetical protein
VQHPAAEIVRNAAETLTASLSAGDASRASRPELDEFSADALDSALKLLAEAQDYLSAGVAGGVSAVAEAMSRVREASNAIDSTRGFVRWMPREVVHARADALQLLGDVTDRW